MTPELFSDAMNEIGTKYVEEALTYKRPAQRSFWASSPSARPWSLWSLCSRSAALPPPVPPRGPL